MVLTRPIAPPAPTGARRRRRWPKVLALVAVILVAAAIAGFLFLKQTDPRAAQDRERLLHALPSVTTYGGSFTISDQKSFARTRAGAKLEDNAQTGPGCDEMDKLLVDHGTAQATENAQEFVNNTIKLSISLSAFESEAHATTGFELAAGDAYRQCLSSALSAGAQAESLQLAATPTALPSPAIGDQATAYRLDLTVTGGESAVLVPIEVVVFRSHRTVITIVAVGSPEQPFSQDVLDKTVTFIDGALKGFA